MKKVISILLCFCIIISTYSVIATGNEFNSDRGYEDMINNFKNPPKNMRVNQMVHEWDDKWGDATYQGKISLLNDWGFKI